MATITKRKGWMSPICLQGHERSITHIQYSQEGDLIFTCSKDNTPMVWWTHNGERLGTFNGHNGSVWYCDVNRACTLLLTGSADRTAKLWSVQDGTCLFTWEFDTPVRCVGWAEGDQKCFFVTDAVMGHPSRIFIHDINNKEWTNQSSEPSLTITVPGNRVKCTVALWTSLNKAIIGGHDDGALRVYDAATGDVLSEHKEHEGKINDLRFSHDKLLFCSASADKVAKLWDTNGMEALKTYPTEKPVNSAHVSSLFDHVIVGGGQDAMSVTTTDTRSGKFQVRFFHSVFEEELGGVVGHFGPINTLEFSPDGKGFASGGEDGFVRIHFFDKEYFEQAQEFRNVENIAI